MRSAFGIKLTHKPAAGLSFETLGGQLPTGESVVFWKDDHGWCGSLSCGGEIIRETIGSASPQACYRGMRGRVANLRNALTKALGDEKR